MPSLINPHAAGAADAAVDAAPPPGPNSFDAAYVAAPAHGQDPRFSAAAGAVMSPAQVPRSTRASGAHFGTYTDGAAATALDPTPRYGAAATAAAPLAQAPPSVHAPGGHFDSWLSVLHSNNSKDNLHASQLESIRKSGTHKAIRDALKVKVENLVAQRLHLRCQENCVALLP